MLGNSIEYLAGVGPYRADLLRKEANVFTFSDLLQYYPFRYVDRTKFYTINEINDEKTYIQLRGRIGQPETVGEGAKKRLVCTLYDAGGSSIQLVWFAGIKFLKESLKAGENYIVFGKPNYFNGTYNMPHPEVELSMVFDAQKMVFLQPVYNSTEKLKASGLDSRGVQKVVKNCFEKIQHQIPENLPPYIVEQLKLVPRAVALYNIHFPASNDALQAAIYRLKFEELFYIQFQLLAQKVKRNQTIQGYIFDTVGDFFNEFYKNQMPFELTNAQKNAVKEIRNDTRTHKQMNRLLQGDVGSGKTVVALLAMLLAMDNGFQACMMAPTEILATQHYNTLVELLKNMPVRIALLTGSTRVAARRKLHAELQSGEIHLLVGTHALIEPVVQFKNLGLAIIDEQHRFGVEQRAALYKKNVLSPHILVMTATPIPRTLALSVYGDLDISTINELPAGRKPIKTLQMTDAQRLRVFGFMTQEIQQGRQIYVVYPLIEESEKLDLKFVMDGFESISRAFPTPEYQVSIVHGKMPAADKEYEMQRFVAGTTNIMVATTVIEVGVNVPNASVMVIENAERFGLSQLHQLRGRVGRGADQSYCILMTKERLSADAKIRINAMVETTDGFKISEIDMQLRGPGDLAGRQQSGNLNLRLADLNTDGEILQQARTTAENILDTDPTLTAATAVFLKNQLRTAGKIDWSLIS